MAAPTNAEMVTVERQNRDEVDDAPEEVDPLDHVQDEHNGGVLARCRIAAEQEGEQCQKKACARSGDRDEGALRSGELARVHGHAAERVEQNGRGRSD